MRFPGRRVLSHFGLRTILVVPFVVQLTVAVAVVWWVAYTYSGKAVVSSVAHLRVEAVMHMRDFVESWLDDPHRINEINRAAIEEGLLDPTDIDKTLVFFWHELRAFPRVSYIQFGGEDRSFVGLERRDDGTFRAWISNQASGYHNCHFSVEDGHLGPQTLPTDRCRVYDPRIRPWYLAAVRAGGPTWSGIYQFSNLHVDQKLSDMAVVPARGPDGKLIGVLGVDLILSQLGDFLNDLDVGKTGLTFILDRDGGLVAGSTIGLPGIIEPNNHILRIRGEESDDPVVAATAAALGHAFPDLSAIEDTEQLIVRVGWERMFVHVLPFSDGRGIDWLLVVVVPEKEFLGDIAHGDRLTLVFVLIAFVASLVLGLFTASQIVRPIQTMNRSARALARGEWSEELNEEQPGEIGQLAASFNKMARDLHQFVTQLEEKVKSRTRELDEKNKQLELEIFDRIRMQEELRRLATEDSLTGAVNRRRFRELGALEVERAKRYRRSLSLILMDLDHFKKVNDTLGHQAGDDVLRVFAVRCRAVARSTDVFARYGGEEFILLLPETPPPDARVVAERVRVAVASEPFDTCAGPVNVTCSLGVAGVDPPDIPVLDTLIARADKAMYQAKENGRNRVQCWVYRESLENQPATASQASR